MKDLTEVYSLLRRGFKEVLFFIATFVLMLVEFSGFSFLLFWLASKGFWGNVILLGIFCLGVFLFSKAKDESFKKIWTLLVPLVCMLLYPPLLLFWSLFPFFMKLFSR